jgi:uncharacterized protein DUF1902
VAESDDVPGLVAEADSPNVLAQKLRILIPELLELNGVPSRPAATFTYDINTKILKSWPADGQLHAKGEGDSSRAGM